MRVPAILRRRTAIPGGDSKSREISELRSAALAYEADGRVGDAIAVWMQLNAMQADAAVEEHLVDLRCDASEPDSNASPPVEWPRPLRDPFPDISAVPPEVDARELSMDRLGGSILHHGCLIVRGLIARDVAEKLQATTDEVFAARERNRDGAPTEETMPWYVPCRQWNDRFPEQAAILRAFNDRCSASHVVDSPRALFQVIDALGSTNVVQVISEYLGESAVLSAEKTLLRRVPPSAKPSWHQDGSFMGTSTRAVNVWIALSDCGEGTDAPGIAILPRRLTGSVRGETLDITLRPDELELASGDVVSIVPRMQPGDALLFDELFLHANGGDRPGLTRDRYALEAWMFASSSMPDYLPIALDARGAAPLQP